VNSSDTRVQTYLDDLARMLSDLDPGERDDVLAGIREHLDAEIGSGGGGDAAVQAALLRLGPPEAVAAEARRGAEPASVPPTTGEPPSTSPRGGGWGRVAVITTMLATLPFLAATVALQAAAVPAEATTGWPEDVGLFGPTGPEAAMLMWLAWPLWILALVCTLAAPPLTRRTRLALALVGPVAFGVVQLAGLWDLGLLSALGGALLALATGIGAIAVGRRAWREATA
jgi:HAAS